MLVNVKIDGVDTALDLENFRLIEQQSKNMIMLTFATYNPELKANILSFEHFQFPLFDSAAGFIGETVKAISVTPGNNDHQIELQLSMENAREVYRLIILGEFTTPA